jgi:hypothetical protein
MEIVSDCQAALGNYSVVHTTLGALMSFRKHISDIATLGHCDLLYKLQSPETQDQAS